MPEGIYKFPKGFLWGTATAAHQVEGQNTNNNWYRWETTPNRIINGDRSGKACDWWGGRWKDDLRQAAADGQNAHRFSIEWSRIQPTPTTWDADVLAFYVDMVKGIRNLGMQPMVTLHHFSDPIWITDMGGWENEQTPDYFAEFVRKVIPVFEEDVQLWITINEPAVYVNGGYVEGSFPPGKQDLGAAFQVLKHLLIGHAAAYKIIHEFQPNAMVGYAKNYRGFEAAHPWFLPDGIVSRMLSKNFNDSFSNAFIDGKLRFAFKQAQVREAIGTQDFVGLNYYTTEKVSFNLLAFDTLFSRRFFPEGAALSETGFIANAPSGMWAALKWAHQFNLPIYVTENGLEDSKDILRPRYTLEHLHQVWRASNMHWNVRGYFHWSLIDNFEWERGWTQRFGLWDLDIATQARTPRKSAKMYARICKENGISTETVQKYAPDAFSTLFPE